MNEEALKDALGQPEPEPENQPAPEPQPEPSPEPAEFNEDAWKETQAEKARGHGWQPYEEYVESGGDPDNWVPADIFNVRGEFMGKLKDKDRQMEKIVSERVQGVKALYDARLKELKVAKKKAVADGDTEEYDRLEKQETDLQIEAYENTTPPQPKTVPEIDEWNEKNQWIYEDSAKADRAKALFGRLAVQGKPVDEILRTVDTAIAKEFPENKPGGTVPGSEKGKGGRPYKSKPKTVGMSDLTHEERTLWKNMPEAWGNDKGKFLKAVADARSAEEK